MASKTLIEADLIINLPSTEQYSNSKSSGSLFLISKYFSPHTYLHRQFVWKMGKNKKYLLNMLILSSSSIDVHRSIVR